MGDRDEDGLNGLFLFHTGQQAQRFIELALKDE